MAALCQRDAYRRRRPRRRLHCRGDLLRARGMSPYLNSNVVFRRVGARLLSEAPRAMYPSTILPCKDGFIHAHYAPADPAILGVLTETPRLSDPDLWETPRALADEIDELLTAWLANYDKYEAVPARPGAAPPLHRGPGPLGPAASTPSFRRAASSPTRAPRGRDGRAPGRAVPDVGIRLAHGAGAPAGRAQPRRLPWPARASASKTSTG